MVSLEDCLDFSDLSTSEIEAIAVHEHVPMIVAAEIGCTLLKSADGIRCLETLFLETAETARSRGCLDEAGRYMAVYEHFHQCHPNGSTLSSSSPSSF